MPVIISVAHQKGGVGKSSLSINLAAYYAKEDISCAVVDADVQGSITTLINTFGEGDKYGSINLIRRTSFSSFSELQNMDQYQVLLIDTPPYLSSNLTEIFQISDYVLVPTKPAVFDMFAIEGTIEMIDAAQKLKTGLKAGVVLNMSNPNSIHNAEIRTHVQGKDIYCFKTEIMKRVEFERCLGYHDSIFSTTDKKAIAEITALGNELLEQLEG